MQYAGRAGMMACYNSSVHNPIKNSDVDLDAWVVCIVACHHPCLACILHLVSLLSVYPKNVFTPVSLASRLHVSDR